ncbi:MAG: alpha/beta hydrolase [Myxococcota bacterium]
MPSDPHEMIVQMLTARPRIVAASVAETRAGFEQLTQMFPLAADVTHQSVDAGGVPAEWVSVPESRADRAILYLHGGGYVIGSPSTHRELASRIARATQARALVIDYRLAPEHPFPAAVEDATAAYRWLLGTGVSASRIAIAGDSAGGGLTLATLLALRDARQPLPASGVCMSPWTDLEGTGASAQPGGADDPLLDLAGLREMGAHYASASPRDPLAAPLYASFRGLPPLLIQVGTRELLLDDSTRVAAKAKAEGVDVTLEAWDGLIHVWQLFGPNVPESEQAVARIGEFARKHFG